MLFLDDVEDLEPIEPAALDPDVQEHELRTASLDRRERFLGCPGGPAAVSLVVEDAGNQFADVGLVVNNQDVGTHRALLRGSAISPAILVVISDIGRRSRFTSRLATARLPSGWYPSGWHPKPDEGTPRGVGVVEEFDSAAMLFHDLADDGETEAGPSFAGRHVGLEQSLPVSRPGIPCRCRPR